MKKIIIFVLMMLLATFFVGCGAKEKLEEKAGEAFAENVIEEAGGGDVDIDGDTVKITGEDGEEVVFGATEWPTSDLAKNIPEFRGGKIVTVMESNDSLFIALEETSEEDFSDYLDEIKQTFTEESYDVKSEGNVTYGAVNGEGIGITLVYISDETFSITVAKISQ